MSSSCRSSYLRSSGPPKVSLRQRAAPALPTATKFVARTRAPDPLLAAPIQACTRPVRTLTRLKRAACATSGHLSLSRTARRAHAGAHLLAGRVAFVFLLRASTLDMYAHLETELLGYLTVRPASARLGGGGRWCTGIASSVSAHRWHAVAIALWIPRVLLCPAARRKWLRCEPVHWRPAAAVCSVRVNACRGEERVHCVTALCEALLGCM